ncbi:hypothetical protein LH51_07955 [Nitrincola sp. A-D6]|uniref:hypothetical protein n=1 Tax=Nitrincola sp. A-D6 TaxID=1545442 RepID=UPI00051FD00E|nr:hypothetical protein [Nitrincola sp. A-D6]KGK42349.1 hypothetical protein LH51_07955 [Nitrincola sp. A-D6]
MTSELTFRIREIRRFILATLTSSAGRRILFVPLLKHQLPPGFDPVYFIAQVSDVIGQGSKSS